MLRDIHRYLVHNLVPKRLPSLFSQCAPWRIKLFYILSKYFTNPVQVGVIMLVFLDNRLLSTDPCMALSLILHGEFSIQDTETLAKELFYCVEIFSTKKNLCSGYGAANEKQCFVVNIFTIVHLKTCNIHRKCSIL